MRIGFVGNIPPPVGGAEIFLQRFLSHFVRHGHSATLVRWRRQIFLYFPERVVRVYAPRGTVTRSRGLSVHYLYEALERPRFERRRVFQETLIAHYLRQGLQTAGIFRTGQVQLVHAHMLFPNVLLGAVAAKALSVPLVLTVHGMLEFRILDFCRTRYPGLADLVERQLGEASLVVATSQEIAAAARARGARAVEQLGGGVDTEYFQPNGHRGPSEDIVFVGSVRKDKGASLLIQAFERLQDQIPGRLVFVGNRLIHGPVFERARRNRRIRFLGTQDPAGVRAAVLRARLVVLPSASEGLSIAVLEAMACEKPVLASRTGELSHVIRDGHNGFLIERRTPVGLAEQIGRVSAREDLQRIGQEARRTAQGYDVRRGVRQYEALYRAQIG